MHWISRSSSFLPNFLLTKYLHNFFFSISCQCGVCVVCVCVCVCVLFVVVGRLEGCGGGWARTFLDDGNNRPVYLLFYE